MARGRDSLEGGGRLGQPRTVRRGRAHARSRRPMMESSRRGKRRVLGSTGNKREPGPIRSDWDKDRRSEEHTSELQSPCNLVCRLLLEKKNNTFVTNQILIRL